MGSSQSPLVALRPSIWKGLVPARRLPGRCEIAISPLIGASRLKAAMASISASMRAEGLRGLANSGRGCGSMASPSGASPGSICGSIGSARRGPALRAAQAPWPMMNARIRPPTMASNAVSVMPAPFGLRGSVLAWVGPARRSCSLRHRQRLVHVDGHDARHALLLHGHANQLFSHFHCDLVV